MRRRFSEALFATSAMALSLTCATVVLRLWHAHLNVPFVYSGDALEHAAMVKGILDDGWWLRNSDVGAPRGQNYAEFPWEPAASLDMAVIKLLGIGTSDPAVVVNLFFLLMFAVIALSAYSVLRMLRISRLVAVVAAVLYSVLPYHFLRGEGHLFLAAYYAVPVACYLVLSVLEGRELFRGRVRALATIGLCAIVATGGVYYAAFAFVLLVASTAVALLVTRRAAALVVGACCAVAIAGGVALQLVPVLIEREGASDAAKRFPSQSEIYGLKLADLVLPLSSHRLGFAREITHEYASATPLPSEGGATLGIVATIGLIGLFAAVLATALSGGSWRPRAPPVRQAGVAALTALLIATTGGGSALIAYLLTPQIRVWARMSIFIAFFALVAIAFGLDALRARFRRLQRGAAAFAGLLAAVLLLGVLDQTSDAFIPPHGEIAEQKRVDRAFVREIERRLPDGALIYQLPYLAFPAVGSPPGRMGDYDPFRLYLNSTRLRWSYGAVRGSRADWAGALQHRPIAALLPGLVAAGFLGITVDRIGYDDNGASVEAVLQGALRVKPLTTAGSRFVFYDMRPYARELRRDLDRTRLAGLRAAILDPIRLEFGESFWGEESDGSQRWRWTKAPHATIAIDNPATDAQTCIFSAVVTAATPGATLLISYPDGTSQRLLTGPRGARIRRRLSVPAGVSSMRLRTDTRPTTPIRGDPRALLYLRVIEADVASALLRRGSSSTQLTVSSVAEPTGPEALSFLRRLHRPLGKALAHRHRLAGS